MASLGLDISVLLDTSVFVDVLRGVAAARAAVERALLEPQVVAASVLTRTELLAELSPRQRAAFGSLAELVRWVSVDLALAERAGEHAARYRRGHAGIDVVDYVVAANAERLDARLWTRNVRHSPMLAELAVPYASE